jgi:arginine exporter protein ArgO
VRNSRFYIYVVLALISAVTTAALAQNLSGHIGLIAGLTTLNAAAFFEMAERKASRTGKNSEMKILSSITEPLYELIILIPVIISLISLDSTNLYFQYLGVSVLGLVIFNQLVKQKLINKLRKTIKPKFGQYVRISTLALTLFLTFLNPFYIFYGIWIIGLISAYDLLEMIYRSVAD